MDESLVKQRAQERAASMRAEAMAVSLQRAFPLAETSSFAGLLQALDEASGARRSG